MQKKKVPLLSTLIVNDFHSVCSTHILHSQVLCMVFFVVVQLQVEFVRTSDLNDGTLKAPQGCEPPGKYTKFLMGHLRDDMI